MKQLFGILLLLNVILVLYILRSTSWSSNLVQTKEDRGPITFNKRQPSKQPKQTPPLNEPRTQALGFSTHSVQPQPSIPRPPIQSKTSSNAKQLDPRIAVHREDVRISAIQNRFNGQPNWIFNTLLFGVFVCCLIILRDPVTQWLNSKSAGSSTSIPGTDSNTNSIPKKDNFRATELETDTALDGVVTVKVNVTQATFSLQSTKQTICTGFAFCTVPVNQVIIVKSEGHHDYYLTPQELSKRVNQTWFINMDKLVVP